jgi:hypothetical protein
MGGILPGLEGEGINRKLLVHDLLERERVPERCNGLNARRMAVLWMCRAPSLGRHIRRELLRSMWLDLTPL